MQKRLRQADPRWSKAILGFGPGTIGRYGCVLTCLCQAAAFLRGMELLPPHLNAMGQGKQAFKGELIIWSAIQGPAGLDIKSIVSGADVGPAIRSALVAKGCCLLHVDHKNDERGDHWILAHSLSDVGDFICSDPATGDDVVISKDTLRGATTWVNEPKVYTVRAARPVFAVT